MVFIAYNEGIDEEVTEMLAACGLSSFTKWQKVLGKGLTSAPHFDTSVWPGANNVCVVVTEAAGASVLLEHVRALRGRFAKEGIKAFVLPVEEVA